MSESAVVTSGDRFIGRVKWFNNKAGYGFITVTSGPKTDSDIFVHHKAINVSVEQYRYLVQGEYIEFSLEQLKDSAHEFQAVNVSGINGGKLMCETRHDFKVARSNYKSDKPDQEQASPAPRMPRQQRAPRVEGDKSEVRPPRQARAPRARGEGPRGVNDDEKKEWTLITKSVPKPRGRKPSAEAK